MAEAGGDEGAEVVGLHLGGDGEGEALPGVARALDDFDGVAHVGQMRLTKRVMHGSGCHAKKLQVLRFAQDDKKKGRSFWVVGWKGASPASLW